MGNGGYCSCKVSTYLTANFQEAKQFADDSERAGTTSRCDRLLRPLTAKVAVLRKLKVAGSKEFRVSIPDSFVGKDPELSSWPRALSLLRKSSSSLTEWGFNEISDWTTDAKPRKRLRRTYSAKSNTEIPFPKPSEKQRAPKESSAEAILRVIQHQKGEKPFVELRDIHGGLALERLSDEEPEIIPFASPELLDWQVECSQRTPLRGAFTNLVKILYPDNWRTLDGLHDALATILKATADTKSSARCRCTNQDQRPSARCWRSALDRQRRLQMEDFGQTSEGAKLKAPPNPSSHCPRSLFATCLRKVPYHMIEEQRMLLEADPDNDTDVSSAIYDELEQMTTSDTGGWRPLKEILRAHSIAILATVIKERLIDSPMARALMVVCLEYGAYDEAATIVESMITIMEPLSKPESAHSLLFAYCTSVTLQAMHSMSIKVDDFKFCFAHLARLFESDMIPLEWISTRDMVDIWNRALISATQGTSDAAEAGNLLRTAFGKGYGKNAVFCSESIHSLRSRERCKRRATDCPKQKENASAKGSASRSGSQSEDEEDLRNDIAKVLSSLLTVLSALSILGLSKAPILLEVGFEAKQASEINDIGLTVGSLSATSFDHLLMCSMAPALAIPNMDFRLLPVLSSLPLTADSFISNLAEYCGRLTLGSSEANDSFNFLEDIIDRFNSRIARTIKTEALQLVYNRVCVLAAYALANRSGRPRHLERALYLERKLHGQSEEQTFKASGRTPKQCRKSSANGFRWEEGICEWVAQTPAVASKIQSPRSSGMANVHDRVQRDSSISSTQGLYDTSCMNNASPCAKRELASKTARLLDRQPDQFEDRQNKSQPPSKRARGRPQKHHRREMSRSRSMIGVKRNAVPKISNNGNIEGRIISSQSWLPKCEQRELVEASKNDGCGLLVLVERRVSDTALRANGAANAMSRSLATCAVDDESQDELSLV